MGETSPNRCAACPARVLPQNGLGRLAARFMGQKNVPPVPSENQLKVCKGSPNLKIGVYEASIQGFTSTGQTVEGTCPAESVYIEADALGIKIFPVEITTELIEGTTE